MPVEYGLCTVYKGWVCIGHVDFIMFVLLLFVLGTQLAHGFYWNTGFVEYSCVSIPNTHVIPKMDRVARRSSLGL